MTDNPVPILWSSQYVICDILCDEQDWNAHLGALEAKWCLMIDYCSQQLKIDKLFTTRLVINLSHNDRLQALNQEFQHKNRPTNVLSFPVYELQDIPENILIDEEQEAFVGEIYLAYAYCYQQAHDLGVSFENYVLHMMIHGFLHIFGYDHQNSEDSQEMQHLEELCLQTLGIESPYDPT